MYKEICGAKQVLIISPEQGIQRTDLVGGKDLVDLTATQLRYVRQKQKRKILFFPMEKKSVSRKTRNRISLKTEQDKVKRPTETGRKGVEFLLIEDVVQSGSQPTGRNGAESTKATCPMSLQGSSASTNECQAGTKHLISILPMEKKIKNN